MPKSTAFLMSALTLLVGFLAGTATGFSSLEGTFDSKQPDSDLAEQKFTDDIKSCEVAFQALRDNLLLECGDIQSEAKMTAACADALVVFRVQANTLKTVCSSVVPTVDDKIKVDDAGTIPTPEVAPSVK